MLTFNDKVFNARRSGRTFRRILEMLCDLSRGTSVIYVSKKSNLCSWYFDFAMKIVSSMLSDDFYEAKRDKLIIKFNNGAYVLFVSVEQNRTRPAKDSKNRLIKTIMDD